MPPSQTLSPRSASRSFDARHSGARGVSAAAELIRFKCGACGERLSVPEAFAGRKGKCPACGNVNRVPTAEQAARPAEIPFPPRSAAPVAPPEPAFAPPPPQQRVAQPAQPARATLAASVAPLTPAASTTSDQPKPLFDAVTERPDRWTRGPLKLEFDDEKPAKRSWLTFWRKPVAKDDELVTLRREWEIDRKFGMPAPVRVAIVVGAILTVLAALWGVFWLILNVVIAVND